jgi:deoxyribonuclease V
VHRWDIAPSQAIQLQKRLAGRVAETPLTGEIRTLAGVDCTVSPDGRRILAAAVLCDAKTMRTLAVATAEAECTFPYVPGLLSFREIPAVLKALKNLPLRPDLLMCDAQGRAHPRRFGLACHVGVLLDIPAIGVAKSLLVGDHRPPGFKRGGSARLVYKGEVVGRVLRTRDDVKPVFVSVGHRVTLEQAVRWTLRCCRGVRLPEPTRRAHQEVTRLRLS